MLNWLRTMDRRWIFLVMLITVTVPVYLQKTFPEATTKIVQDGFDLVEALPSGSLVVFAMDYDPGSQAELHPMAKAITRHCCERGHKMIFLTLWPGSGPLVDEVQTIIEKEFAGTYVYGRDYVNLGYKAGNEMVIKVIVDNLRGQYKTDKTNTSLDLLELTKDIESVREAKLIVSISAGTPGAKEWVLNVASRFNIPLIAGSTGVQSTQLYPYYPNQVTGLLAAIKGAAEYEAALTKAYPKYDPAVDPAAKGKNTAIQRMAPQLWAHLLMILLIALGNLIYFLDRRSGGRR